MEMRNLASSFFKRLGGQENAKPLFSPAIGIRITTPAIGAASDKFVQSMSLCHCATAAGFEAGYAGGFLKKEKIP